MARYDGICPTCKKPICEGGIATFSSEQDFISNARMRGAEIRYSKLIDTSTWEACPVCGGKIRAIYDEKEITIWCLNACSYTIRLSGDPECIASKFWYDFTSKSK